MEIVDSQDQFTNPLKCFERIMTKDFLLCKNKPYRVFHHNSIDKEPTKKLGTVLILGIQGYPGSMFLCIQTAQTYMEWAAFDHLFKSLLIKLELSSLSKILLF